MSDFQREREKDRSETNARNEMTSFKIFYVISNECFYLLLVLSLLLLPLLHLSKGFSLSNEVVLVHSIISIAVELELGLGMRTC